MRMKKRILFSAFTVLAAFAFSIPMFAHHGAWEFDLQHETTVMGGRVTHFKFVNPHVEISWETKDDKGATQQWTAETTNPNTLYRYGWNKDILKPGTELQMVAGNRCKNGENCMRLRKIVLATGKDLPVPD
jgi:uncharacterized protein DUF6152